jgi:hypothetical protein
VVGLQEVAGWVIVTVVVMVTVPAAGQVMMLGAGTLVKVELGVGFELDSGLGLALPQGGALEGVAEELGGGWTTGEGDGTSTTDEETGGGVEQPVGTGLAVTQEQTAAADSRTWRAVSIPQALMTQPWARLAMAEFWEELHWQARSVDTQPSAEPADARQED